MPRGIGRKTIDHMRIKTWALLRGGVPATDPSADSLHINFPDQDGDENLDEITWSEFFRRFDEAGLALELFDEDETVPDSRYRLVPRTT